MPRGRKYGISFSWKRALGISGAKQRLSRRIGIPLTRSGLERKIGREAMRGCATLMVGGLGVVAVVVALVR